MKIIIAGAGIGGIALAALLRQQGREVELYERAENFDRSGYMLGLWPMGSRVLMGLGLVDKFLAISAPMESYAAHNGAGEKIVAYPFGETINHLGYTGCLMRGELLTMLRSKCEDVPLHFNTSVEGFTESGDKVTVRLSDGTEKTCDLLVGADGIHSKIREDFLAARRMRTAVGAAGSGSCATPSARPPRPASIGAQADSLASIR